MRLHFNFGKWGQLLDLFRKADNQIQFIGDADQITVQRRGIDDAAEITIDFTRFGKNDYFVISGKDAKRLSKALVDIFEEEPTKPSKVIKARNPVVRR